MTDFLQWPDDFANRAPVNKGCSPIVRLAISIVLILSLLVTVGALLKPERPTPSNQRADKPGKEIALVGNEKTVVVPHLATRLQAGRNYVYCATMQLAWNDLQRLLGGPVEMMDPPDYLDVLNNTDVDELKLSENSYLVKSGLLQRKNLQRAVEQRFGSTQLEIPKINPKQLTVYAYLRKVAKFKKAFENLDTPIVFRTGEESTKLTGFGIDKYELRTHRSLGAQASMLHYTIEDGFVVQLHTTSPDDVIILAMIQRGDSLQQMIASVENRIKDADPLAWERDDSLRIPIINVDVDHDFTELLGKPLLNSGWSAFHIDTAKQRIRFRLDERGVRLESDAEVVTIPNGERRCHFNKPFLIYLKERGSSMPYFVAWIESP